MQSETRRLAKTNASAVVTTKDCSSTFIQARLNVNLVGLYVQI